MDFIPNLNREYQVVDLKNGSNACFNVDGSSVAQTFKWDAPSGEMWYLECVAVHLYYVGSWAPENFTALGSPLTTGLKLHIKVHGNDFILKEIKDNFALIKVFPRNTITQMDPAGFIKNSYFGCSVFNDYIQLKGSSSDQIKLVVSDDLTGVTRAEASVTLWRPK